MQGLGCRCEMILGIVRGEIGWRYPSLLYVGRCGYEEKDVALLDSGKERETGDNILDLLMNLVGLATGIADIARFLQHRAKQ